MLSKVHLLALSLLPGILLSQSHSRDLQRCGEAYYSPSNYTCYDTDFLCPVIDGIPTLRCGPDCYLPSMYSCSNNHLVYPPMAPVTGTNSTSTCTTEATILQLNSPPYENYFYSDCHSASQVVVTSPLPDSNLNIIGPRIIVAWPAGNSGIVVYFEPANGINGTLGINLRNSSSGRPLSPIYDDSQGGNATVGITTQVEFNSTAVLSVAILGSIRTIRDFVEGPSLLRDDIQDALTYSSVNGGVEVGRLWLDNITTTSMSLTPLNATNSPLQISNGTVTFPAGAYIFNASFNYPQLTQLTAKEVLSSNSADLITQSPSQTTSLSFLSYTTKLTAGAWRFLTYFGRDSMIAALLLEPVLSEGDGGAIEAVIAGVLERINSTDGSVCHEEKIGDYATWTHLQNNITSTAPLCDYKMIDTDYFLPTLVAHYFLQNPVGSTRASAFLNTTASIFPENSNLTYAQLFQISSSKIVSLATPFTAPGNQTIANLMHLKNGEIVGEWRDSTYGIGGGRIPFDVNTALMPAALRAIASLSRAGILNFDAGLIDGHAKVWEDSTLQFFEVSVPVATAKARVEAYAQTLSPTVNSQSTLLDDGAAGANITFHALALQGNNNLSQVAVMNTDSCFRLFLLNTTDQGQLTAFLNSTASSVRRRFPAGLMTDVGMLVANPAFGSESVYARNWTNSAYHGTVVWSWQLAMMAKGLELQLARCSNTSASDIPEFCTNQGVYNNVKTAYNTLWDSIEENEQHLSTEVWSWIYDAGGNGGQGKFGYVDLGSLPPPEGVGSTESDIVQLWSLTFLAVKRSEGLR